MHKFSDPRRISCLHHFYLWSIKETKNFQFFFKRHCLARQILIYYDWMLAIDGDVGITNPYYLLEVKQKNTITATLNFAELSFSAQHDRC